MAVLEETREDDLQALRAGGAPVFRAVTQIRAELLHALGEEHAALFAEPNANAGTGTISWRSSGDGEAVRLDDLGSSARRVVEDNLNRLFQDISDYVEKLAASAKTADQAMANILTLAMEIPDPSHIFAVGTQPVIAAWGHVPRGPATLRQVLREYASDIRRKRAEERSKPASEAPKVGSTTESGTPGVTQVAAAAVRDPVRSRYWLIIDSHTSSTPIAGTAASGFGWMAAILWPLFALTLLVIGYLLLKNCAIAWPGSSDFSSRVFINLCASGGSVASSSGLTAPSQENLLRRIQELDTAIEEKRRACVPPASPQTDSSQRVEEAHGKIGKMNVILTWSTEDDLDLHVVCPEGARIFFSNRSACGGNLDVDQNASASSSTSRPVENIYWDDPKEGEYSVQVDLYDKRSSAPGTDFKVELKIDGQTVETHCGKASALKSPNEVFKFKLPYQGQGHRESCR